MILRDDGEVESASDESKCESMSAFEDVGDVEYIVNSESLVILSISSWNMISSLEVATCLFLETNQNLFGSIFFLKVKKERGFW